MESVGGCCSMRYSAWSMELGAEQLTPRGLLYVMATWANGTRLWCIPGQLVSGDVYSTVALYYPVYSAALQYWHLLCAVQQSNHVSSASLAYPISSAAVKLCVQCNIASPVCSTAVKSCEQCSIGICCVQYIIVIPCLQCLPHHTYYITDLHPSIH